VKRDSAQPQGYGATNPIKPANAGDSFSSFAHSSSLMLDQSLSPASRACAINAGRTADGRRAGDSNRNGQGDLFDVEWAIGTHTDSPLSGDGRSGRPDL